MSRRIRGRRNKKKDKKKEQVKNESLTKQYIEEKRRER